MPQTTAAKPAENPRTRYLDSLTLADALWWFIENMAPDNPDRSDLFFYLRSRFRSERQPAPLTFGAPLWLFTDSTIAQMHRESEAFAGDAGVDSDLRDQASEMRDTLQKQADMRGEILTQNPESAVAVLERIRDLAMTGRREDSAARLAEIYGAACAGLSPNEGVAT